MVHREKWTDLSHDCPRAAQNPAWRYCGRGLVSELQTWAGEEAKVTLVGHRVIRSKSVAWSRWKGTLRYRIRQPYFAYFDGFTLNLCYQILEDSFKSEVCNWGEWDWGWRGCPKTCWCETQSLVGGAYPMSWLWSLRQTQLLAQPMETDLISLENWVSAIARKDACIGKYSY